MKIQVNGEPYEAAGPLTLSALLAELDVDPRRVAVEHNLVVVKRDRLESTTVAEGDEIEIVNFVGGGSERQPLSKSITGEGEKGRNFSSRS